MNEKQYPTLNRYIGSALKAWREKNGYLQEDVASAANRVELPWRKTTVSAVEAGRRPLTPEELVLLPWVINLTRCDHGGGYENFVELADLLPDDETVELASDQPEPILLSGKTIKATFANKLRDIFQVESVQITDNDHKLYPTAERASRSDDARLKRLRSIFKKVWPSHNPDVMFINRIEQESRSGAVEKLARKLEVPPFAVAVAARRLWKVDLETHRELQLFGRTADKTLPQIQAMRAHVTRKLIKELDPILAELQPKSKKPR